MSNLSSGCHHYLKMLKHGKIEIKNTFAIIIQSSIIRYPLDSRSQQQSWILSTNGRTKRKSSLTRLNINRLHRCSPHYIHYSKKSIIDSHIIFGLQISFVSKSKWRSSSAPSQSFIEFHFGSKSDIVIFIPHTNHDETTWGEHVSELWTEESLEALVALNHQLDGIAYRWKHARKVWKMISLNNFN